MKNTISIALSFFLVTLCVSTLRVEGICLFGHKTRIFVYNNLPSQLIVHCASGDDDRGLRVVLPNENMNWGFCAYPKTLYFCHLWWGQKQKAFEAFKGRFLKTVNSKYNYVAKEDGIYYFPNDSPRLMEKISDWE